MNAVQTLSRTELTQKAMTYGIRANLSNSELIEAITDIEAGRPPNQAYLKKDARTRAAEWVTRYKAAAGGGAGVLIAAVLMFIIGRYSAVCHCSTELLTPVMSVLSNATAPY